MDFDRIKALIKKEWVWILGNKQLWGTAIVGFLFIAGLIFLEISLWKNPEQNVFALSKLPAFLYIFMVYMMAMILTSTITAQENIDGTFVSLLTTPLKPLEFFIGKSFLPFCLSVLCCVMIAGLNLIFHNYSAHFNPLVLLNIMALNIIFCIIACIIGCLTKTLADFRSKSGLTMILLCLVFFWPTMISMLVSTYPAVKGLEKFVYFSPGFHFMHIIDNNLGILALLFHTVFNLGLTGLLVLFAVAISGFVLSRSDKPVSPRLYAKGLTGLLVWCLLSTGLSPLVINKLKGENKALIELREEVKKSKNQGLIPLEDFFKNPEIAQVKLSPDGKYLAYLKAYKGRLNIHVRAVGSLNEKRISSQTKRDIFWFFWKENQTLIYLKDQGGDENYHIYRTFVDLDDKKITSKNEISEKDLTPFRGVKALVLDPLDNIADQEMLIKMNKRDKSIFDVYRLNVSTGEIKLIEQNPGTITGWGTDYKGQLRIALSTERLKQSLLYRESEQEEFKKIKTVDFKSQFVPLRFTSDNKNLYVLHNLDTDKAVIAVFDPRKKQFLSQVFSHPEVDLSSLHYSKKRKVLTRVGYTTWKQQYHFLDPTFENLFKDLKALFPNKEIEIVSMNRNEDKMLVAVFSDTDPGTYWFYDSTQKTLKKIASTHPWLNPEQLSQMKPLSYKARDGLTIPAYLTLPKAVNRPLPIVVFPHGGPWLRDFWTYHPEVQFLASRGYGVLQMNFRGSTGYGKKFWEAGFKQWGRAMQDDITDGVKYLIDQGIADPKKIAIYGISYGGYAVLAGLAFTPDLYACGVDYVGVSNIFTLLKSIPPYWKPKLEKFYQKIGHPETDKELLKAISPVFHADKIKAPLFIAQGAMDPRVKKAESDQMVKALKKRGVSVPYLVKKNEGHGFRNEENRLEFYKLMEAFLKKCLQ